MKRLMKHLEILKTIKREKHHPLIYQIHKKHRISRKTLLYVKEYGPHTNVTKTIIRESIKILLIASILSSFGGFVLENIKEIFISITPLIILLPVLNDMVGNYGAIISSRFTTLLHERKIGRKWGKNAELRNLILQIAVIASIVTVISSLAALSISYFAGYSPSMHTLGKIILISLIDVSVLIFILFLVAVVGGIYIYKKGEDPNNFLIPITTSVGDFGNMVILAALIIIFF